MTSKTLRTVSDEQRRRQWDRGVLLAASSAGSSGASCLASSSGASGLAVTAKRRGPIMSMRQRRSAVLKGYCGSTAGGLTGEDLMYNDRGVVVSSKISLQRRRHPWIVATKVARKVLNIQGFVPMKKDTEFYECTKRTYNAMKTWDIGLRHWLDFLSQ